MHVPPLPPQQAAFDLEFAPAPAVTPLPRHLRLISSEGFGPRPTPSSALPPLTAWGGRLAIALAEVLAGSRPSSQLGRWLAHEVMVGVHQLARPWPTRSGRTRRPAMKLRSLRIAEPSDGVAEIAAIVTDGGRPLVLALRLEGLDGRWVCTEVGTPGGWRLRDHHADEWADLERPSAA